MTQEHFPPGREVVILGAGFSKAVSDYLPTSDKLGNEVLTLLRKKASSSQFLPSEGQTFRDGGFERWLSQLAEEQPYRSIADNFEAAALFSKVSNHIFEHMAQQQKDAFDSQVPQWFWELLNLVQARNVTIISFNYDNLIEWGVTQHSLKSSESGSQRVEAIDVLDNMPPLAQRPTFEGREFRESFKLLKLHGSLSWFWTPGDESGATLQRWEPNGGYGNLFDGDHTARRRVLPGREPFIVPPTTTKSAYFRNPITRELWRRSYEELSEASRWILIGYSLPLEDQAAAAMFSEAYGSGNSPQISVVDLKPDKVVLHLNSLGVIPHESQNVDITMSVDEFVKDYSRLQAKRIVDEMRQLPSGEGNLIVTWAKGGASGGFTSGNVRQIVPTTSDSTEVVLILGEGPITVNGDMFDELQNSLKNTQRIVVRTHDGTRTAPIIQVNVHAGGLAARRQINLYPSGRLQS